MIDIKPGEHLGMIGTTGSGKTVFFRKVFMPHLDRLIVVDTEERQFNDLPIIKGDPMKFMRKIPRDKYFRWRWVPNPSTQPEDMEILAEAAIAYGDNLAIYIDELTDFSSATSMGVWLKSLFRKARKRNINLYWASQRPAGVNTFRKNTVLPDPVVPIMPRCSPDLISIMAVQLQDSFSRQRSAYIRQSCLPQIL